MNEELSEELEHVSRLGEAGKLDEALHKINECLLVHVDSAQVYNMLGNVHVARGETESAISAYKSAIRLDNRFTNAYHNLADTYFQLGADVDATQSYDKVLELAPNNSEAIESLIALRRKRGEYRKAQDLLEILVKLHPNTPTWLAQLAETSYVLEDYPSAIQHYEDLVRIEPTKAEYKNALGTACFMSGDYERAHAAYQQAERLEPHDTSVLCNLGAVNFALRNYWNAAVYFDRSSQSAPQRIDLRQKLAAALKETRNFPDCLHAESMFLRILEYNCIIDPQLLIDPILLVLRRTIDFQELLNRSRKKMSRNEVVEMCNFLQQRKLFLEIIQLCPIPDLDIETLLKNLRRNILELSWELRDDETILTFQEALALYSHVNDFVLSVTEKEKIELSNLVRESKELDESGRTVGLVWIACVASYRPLNAFPELVQMRSLKKLERLFKRHVLDQEIEQRFRGEIPSVGLLADPVSISVRSQYEAYLYPRWVNTEVTYAPQPLSYLARGLKLKLRHPVDKFDNSPKLLVAGCGTGQHAISASSRVKNCRAVAIDLSLGSLSYASRKTTEFGLSNIKYVHADILDVVKLGQKFAVIECCGVLHHMADPFIGLKELVRVLEPGGIMKIALYSSLARRSVSVIRRELTKMGIENSIEDIRSFRDEVVHGTAYDSKVVKQIIGWKDFYNTSECVDLLFHVKEHHFSLPLIQEYLAKLELSFAGFEFSNIQVVEKFKRFYPRPDQYYSLNLWDKFEQEFPSTFAGMYQFWVQKNLE